MNESTSKSSLASSIEKPSTANSISSPNGRKTRTIIVARTIPEDPAKVTPAATRDEGVSSVVNQQHARDARSGKLASYAALGGDEDVERFDKFLAEQRGQPSASELRAAATSPHHMVASMKRKTMSRIQLEGINIEAAAAGEDAATRKFMQQEMESDARKRREEAVTHRKWLNSLPIHERVSQQRQQNALRKWRQTNREWETFKTRAARRLGKTPQELVMSKAAAYREQREMYDALQKAKPLSDKVGGDIWLVSLRNEGTRYVPVGNIFSGLFCPIRESTNLGPRVRRPLDYHGNDGNREHESSRPMSKLEKRSLNLLERKKWRLRKQLEMIQPHEIGCSSTSHLSVGTEDLFAWASDATEKFGGGSDEEESVRSYSTEIDEAARRRRLRSYASPSSPKSVTKAGSSCNQFAGPSLRISYVADENDDAGKTSASDAIRKVNTPETCLPPLRLSFYTPVGEQEQRSLSITNDGNSIVHYQWWRAPFEDENAKLTTHLRGNRSRNEEQELERFTTTSVSTPGGTLLPGEAQRFAFSFESSKAGIFLEKWLLDADPKPRVCFDGTPQDFELGVELPVEVRLSCVAEDNFVARRGRAMQLTCVERRESRFFVASLVDEILDGVRPPEPVTFDELMPREDVSRFYDQNGSSEFSDVYYSPDLVRDCYALYERAQEVLRRLVPTPPPAVEESNPNEEDAANDGADATYKPSDAVPPVISEQNGSAEGINTGVEELQDNAPDSVLPADPGDEWNWRLETLRELCKTADEAQHIQKSRLTHQLIKEFEEVEEDDENEDEEEEGGDESDDGGDDVEGDDDNGESTAVKSPRLTQQEVRQVEILARRKALEDEIQALEPNLQESFDTLRFSACTAPYTSSRLQERLFERIGNLCSETPVVCEITMAMHTGAAAQTFKVEGVGELLTRAIDEAIGGDQDHQSLFEQERRRAQKMWLGDKSCYSTISQWMAKVAVSTSQLPPVDTPVEGAVIKRVDNSGVILMHVDLDLASWFSLVKMESKDTPAVTDGISSKLELTWRFSQELVQHSSFVPAKVARAAESLEKLLSVLASAKPVVHTIILVSELSRPPLTRQMCKLLRSAAQAELKSKAAATTGDSEESKLQEGEGMNEAAEEDTMNSLLQNLASQLSLRSVAQVVQRAIKKDVVFCSAIEEVQGQIEISRKELQLNTSASLEVPENEAPDTSVEDNTLGIPPRILLLEHLDEAGMDLITHASRKRELASKPITPAPVEPQKPVAGGKKPSVATPAKGKPNTPSAPVPPPENPPSVPGVTKPELTGKELREQGTRALRDQFARIASACVLDGIPSQQREGSFAFAPKLDDPYPQILTFAGPMFSQELATWSRLLQPTLGDQPTLITAVVGGKCLESKLRLIDGLLELVHEIYFVGEVAMSLYRALHTKRLKTAPLSQTSAIHQEADEELEEDAEDTNVDVGTTGDAVREDAIEFDSEKHSGAVDGVHPRGLWDLLVPAVQKLQQKASRKCVRLLLPLDWIVGETPLEENTETAADEDNDEEESEEEEEEEEEEDNGGRKRRASALKSARQKPIMEPDHVDTFEQKSHAIYDGDRAHVVLGHGLASDAGWQTFQEVTTQCLANARVTEGKKGVLVSLRSESESDDIDEETDPEAVHKPSPAKFGYEWTFRGLDVGPIAMTSLASLLRKNTGSKTREDGGSADASRALIIHGVCGAVEFREFCVGTNQLLRILQDYPPSDVFIAGSSTATWLRQLENDQLNNVASGQEKKNSEANSTAIDTEKAVLHRRVVDDRTVRNARVLKQLVAAKPHAILASLVSSEQQNG
ncbi:MYCBP-associated protein [Phytophthora citrophthora]|uniref:phosphoglycerate kinase n=1 Tax=Phytophthora citrophthora TaxID=4793 RepID=A0AAD9G295_9STRA|nr:MYCBP-associated protein [Phytophthora citrophthora]